MEFLYICIALCLNWNYFAKMSALKHLIPTKSRNVVFAYIRSHTRSNLKMNIPKVIKNIILMFYVKCFVPEFDTSKYGKNMVVRYKKCENDQKELELLSMFIWITCYEFNV